MLPVINVECVRQAVRTGLGLKAQINNRSVFDRKNYFYPDLPQGYQISQFQQPIVGEGTVIVSVGPDSKGQFEEVEVGVERLHLEQDAGKSLHDQHATMSFVDLNRSGVALMEIVSKPDMRSADEARAYLTKLRTILRYLGTCDGNMDEGSMRADVNVSCGGGRRVRHALRDQERQLDPLRRTGDRVGSAPPDRDHRRRRHDRSGNAPLRPGQGRDARDALQGRRARLPLFPGPRSPAARVRRRLRRGAARENCPNCPTTSAKRLMGEAGLSAYDASILVSEKSIADFFEQVAKGRDAKQAANWVINDLLGALNKSGKSIEETPVSAYQLGAVLDLIREGDDFRQDRQGPFRDRLERGGDPRELVESRG